MVEPRDGIDDWLSEPVRPLQPQPGAFALVRKRARRRKLRQAVVSAGAAAAVVAAALATPPLITSQFSSRPAAGPGRGAGPGRPGGPSPTSAPPLSPTFGRGGQPAPPRNFQPSSVTFIGTQTGWALGQVGSPGRCAGQAGCAALARTDDTGASWHGVTAPPADVPDGATGAGQVRFLNASDGWVFGPQLWATHDGGRSWRQIPTAGLRVTALETVRGRAFAIWARCSGSGAGFAAGCVSFSLYSTPVGRDRWAPVPGAVGLTAGGAAASAALVLTSGQGYLLAPNGELLRGPVSGGGWQPAGAGLPCAPGSPRPSGQPSTAMLASTGPGLLLLCAGPAAGGVQRKTLYYSADGGQTWRTAGSAPAPGVALSLSGSPSGAYLVATDRGVALSRDGGASWLAAGGPLPPGGFSYLGMTFPLQGVAVPADPRQRAVWITRDGGLTWQKSPIG